jgi:hypothetical protein
MADDRMNAVIDAAVETARRTTLWGCIERLDNDGHPRAALLLLRLLRESISDDDPPEDEGEMLLARRELAQMDRIEARLIRIIGGERSEG